MKKAAFVLSFVFLIATSITFFNEVVRPPAVLASDEGCEAGWYIGAYCMSTFGCDASFENCCFGYCQYEVSEWGPDAAWECYVACTSRCFNHAPMTPPVCGY
jgi:hypothetical protein